MKLYVGGITLCMLSLMPWMAFGAYTHLSCGVYNVTETDAIPKDTTKYGSYRFVDSDGLIYVRQWTCSLPYRCLERAEKLAKPTDMDCLWCPGTCMYAGYIIKENRSFVDFNGHKCRCHKDNEIICSTPEKELSKEEKISALCE